MPARADPGFFVRRRATSGTIPAGSIMMKDKETLIVVKPDTLAAASYCFAVFFAFSAALASRTFAFSAALALASRTFSHARTSRRRN